MQPAKKEKKDKQFCIKNSYPPKHKAHLITRQGDNKNVDKFTHNMCIQMTA